MSEVSFSYSSMLIILIRFFKVFLQLLGKKFCESATMKCKLACSLKPRTGSFSTPVTYLLLPPKGKDEQIQ